MAWIGCLWSGSCVQWALSPGGIWPGARVLGKSPELQPTAGIHYSDMQYTQTVYSDRRPFHSACRKVFGWWFHGHWNACGICQYLCGDFPHACGQSACLQFWLLDIDRQVHGNLFRWSVWAVCLFCQSLEQIQAPEIGSRKSSGSLGFTGAGIGSGRCIHLFFRTGQRIPVSVRGTGSVCGT